MLAKFFLILAVSSEITNLQAMATNDNTLSFSWAPPISPNGVLVSYSVSITNLVDDSTVRTAVDVTSTLVGGLGML